MTTITDSLGPKPTAGTFDPQAKIANALGLKFATGANVQVAALNSLATGYWALFWVMNGLDKFLNRSDVGPFNWYGKDRTEQFGGYFERMNLSGEFIDLTLYFAGIWELIVAVPLVVATFVLLFRPSAKLTGRMLTMGFVLTGLTLIGFSVFDVIAGDRAELREHGLYLALMFVCCIWIGLNRTGSPSR